MSIQQVFICNRCGHQEALTMSKGRPVLPKGAIGMHWRAKSLHLCAPCVAKMDAFLSNKDPAKTARNESEELLINNPAFR